MSSIDSAAAELFTGCDETADYMRQFPWETTALGPVDQWPQSLKTAIRIMMTSRQPIWIGWGEDLIYLYNDPYKSIIGGRHPWALGKPVKKVWREIWREIAPMLATAMSGTEGIYVEEQLLLMERNGYPEETYYTFSYSPIPDDNNNAGGIICANTDDTKRVIGERQLALLRHLAAQTAGTWSLQAVCEKSVAALATNGHDLPFAALYLENPDTGQLTLAGTAGLEPGHPAAPAELDPLRSPWPLEQALVHHQSQLIADLSYCLAGVDLPCGVWDQPPSRAVVLPITPTGETGRAGVMVVGLNPFRLYDSDYEGFLQLVAGQISAALANAQAYEQERRRAEALAEIDKAKTIFFSNVSHEFRTPLTLMLGPLQQVLENADLPDAVRDLPVILLSARAGDEATIEGLGIGAEVYLTKPFQARELKTRVRAVLAKEEARREQESHFHMIADKAPIILWTTDETGACTYLSRQWYEFTGGTPEQDLGFGWLDRTHPLDLDIARSAFLDANRERTPFCVEYRLRGMDGSYRWMIDTGTPRFDETGQLLGYVGCVFDIGERRRMEAILDAQKSALELSVSGAPLKQMLDVFIEAVETQSGGRVRASILLVNDSRDRLVCGAAPSLPEALRNAIDGLPIGPHSAVCGTAAYLRQAIFVGDVTTDSRCAAYCDLAVSSGIQACWSTPVFSSEGTLLAVFALYYPHTLAEPLVGDAQMVEILGSTVALIIDKTIDTRLRREAEQKLRASEAALREADKRKDEFLATLAHELRNPLAPISNALQIMRLSPDVGAVSDMRELINRQLTQMVRLVDDLMDVSRITRGKVDLRRERVSLASVLQNTVEVVRPLVDERAQTLQMQLPERPVWLHADFTRLSQVFTNIVNNACKYTQTGGAIAIAASVKDGAVAVTVEDNGMGIPADKLPLIFEMFSQVEDPIGRTHGGLGIGLTLAEQLVKMHGGHVEAHSDGPGKGSRFTVYLPLETGADAGGSAQGRREARPGAGLRVLVVDDNRESARTLAQLIELLGHQTQVAFDGAEALELADQLVPDLVLMDLGMPGMDGFETCKAMKRNPLLRDAVLVAQTGWGEKRHNQLAQEAGFAHHLVKPIDLQALEELLADIAPAY